MNVTNYFGVDYTLVWDVVTNRMPELLKKLEKILDSLILPWLPSTGGHTE